MIRTSTDFLHITKFLDNFKLARNACLSKQPAMPAFQANDRHGRETGDRSIPSDGPFLYGLVQRFHKLHFYLSLVNSWAWKNLPPADSSRRLLVWR